jgi:MFS family permease
MSHSASLTDYRKVFSPATAKTAALASLCARLPLAMIGLSLLLYVRHQTGSFAVAGFVAAAALIGVASGSVVQGRLADRFGPSRPLLAATALLVVFAALTVLAVEMHAHVIVLVGLAFCVGLAEPAVGPSSRALWTRILPAGPVRSAALTYEALSFEVFFILGPGLAGVLVAMPWPGTGFAIAVACMAIGTTSFALLPVNRTARGIAGLNKGNRFFGALAVRGMRPIVLAALGFGLTIGFAEVAVPAAATAAGSPTAGGLLLSLWSVTSVLFGVVYNLSPWPRQMRLRLPFLLAAFAALMMLSAIPTSLLGLGVTLMVSGAMLTPQTTTHSAAVDIAAPRHMTAEAFSWTITASTTGLALGQSLGGQIVTNVSTSAAFVASGIGGLLVAVAVYATRVPASPRPVEQSALVSV